MSHFRVTDKAKLAGVLDELSAFIDAFGSVTFDVVAGESPRTLTQNNCLHLYCDLLAKSLNAAGLDMRKVMKPEAELPWSKYSVKENLWRPIQMAICGKDSTRDPTTVEYQEIYKALDRHLSTKFGAAAHVEWPTRFNNEA